MSAQSLVDESTPEERLKKYKEQLAKMAELENKSLKSSPSEKKTDTPEEKTPQSDTNVKITKQSPQPPHPPSTLVSPSKRELRESQVVSNKSKRDALVAKLSEKDSKSRIMLKARMKAIDSKLQDIKIRKATIEREYKRKRISKSEYERRIEVLVHEGKELLKEKAKIDKSLSI